MTIEHSLLHATGENALKNLANFSFCSPDASTIICANNKHDIGVQGIATVVSAVDNDINAENR
jgi:hypothetical protein